MAQRNTAAVVLIDECLNSANLYRSSLEKEPQKGCEFRPGDSLTTRWREEGAATTLQEPAAPLWSHLTF